MNKMLRIFILALVAAAGLSGLGRAAEIPRGQTTYGAKCASCHAKDGGGNPTMAKALKVESATLSLISETTQKKTDDALVKVTSDGVNKMPAYKAKLSEAEIKDTIAYIRFLATAK